MFGLLLLHLDVSLCSVMYVQSLILEGRFHFHLLNMERFSVLILDLSLRFGPTSTICVITTSFEPTVVQYETDTNVKWNLEASSVNKLRMDLCDGDLLSREFRQLIKKHSFVILQFHGAVTLCYGILETPLYLFNQVFNIREYLSVSYQYQPCQALVHTHIHANITHTVWI